MPAKKRKRRRKRKFKDTLRKVFTCFFLVVLFIGLFFWLNDRYFSISGIPSTFDVIAGLGLGPKPHVQLDVGETSVSFIDVGQGDCTLIMSNEKNILIDCGEEEKSDTVIGYLEFAGVKKLDLVIVSHPHSDHYGGMAHILQRFDCDLVLMPEIDESMINDKSAYALFMRTVEKRNIELKSPVIGEEFRLADNAFLEILSPIRTDYEDLNDVSIMARYEHGENSFLFTGDVGFEAEYDIIDSGADIDVDILKVGHHGSAGSTSEEFLHYVTPETAVFEVAKENKYGHPKREVFERLARAGCDETYSTAYNGNIVFVSDGVSLEKITERKDAIYINQMFDFG